jgi:hypothetical protein
MRPITTIFLTSFSKNWGDIIKLCTKLVKFKNRLLSFLETGDDNQNGTMPKEHKRRKLKFLHQPMNIWISFCFCVLLTFTCLPKCLFMLHGILENDRGDYTKPI